MLEKFKYFLQNDQLFYGLIVILVAVASFSLGRASMTPIVAKNTIPPVTLLSVPLPVSIPMVTAGEDLETGQLVASKSGSKYHLISCPGAKQIKAENKIFFTSKVQAEAAGYKPAANCPELQ